MNPNFDFDATRMSCCERDEAEQKQAQAWRSELNRLDPVEQRLNQIRLGGALNFTPKPHHNHSAEHAEILDGVPVEADECNLLHMIESSTEFLLCLACPAEETPMESRIKEYLEGFEAPIIIHRFRPYSTCRTRCFVTGTMQLPALLAFSNGKACLTLERNRLEAESESGLLTRLMHLKRLHAKRAQDEGEEDEEKQRVGRNKYFQCGKQGCDRTFHHVHVKSQFKYKEDDEDKDDEKSDYSDDN